MATYIIRLLSDWFELFIRDNRFLGPNAPLGGLEPSDERCSYSECRSGGGSSGQSSESPSRNDLYPWEG